MAIAAKTKKKPAAHTQKRQALHHRQSKSYKKTYWPYLPMLAIVGLGFAFNILWSGNGQVLGDSSNFASTHLLDTTNEQRAAAGLQDLKLNEQLRQAAQAKAEDMATHNYWAHESPDGKTPWTFIGATGYQYQSAGENLAYGFKNASQVTTGWMNSQEHRDNLLNAEYANVGYGVAQAVNYRGKGPETIVVAEYAQPAGINVSFSVPEHGQAAAAAAAREVPANRVSRIQLLTNGDAAWSALVVSALAGAALAIFIVRHGVRLKKLIVEGEAFVVHHPALDTTIVLIATIGILLIQTSGNIR